MTSSIGNIFEVDWIPKYLKRDPKVFMEIGAAFGVIASRVKSAYPSCRTFVIEPSEAFKSTLIKISKEFNMEYHKIALGDRIGEVKFFQSYGKSRSYSSTYAPSKKLRDRAKRKNLKFIEDVVPMTTITKFCDSVNVKYEDVDILHIDVHGAELPIIRTMGDIRPNIVFMETKCFKLFNCGYDKNKLDKLMSELGYKIEKELKYDTLYIKN